MSMIDPVDPTTDVTTEPEDDYPWVQSPDVVATAEGSHNYDDYHSSSAQ